jgi:hypothetical protein
LDYSLALLLRQFFHFMVSPSHAKEVPCLEVSMRPRAEGLFRLVAHPKEIGRWLSLILGSTSLIEKL